MEPVHFQVILKFSIENMTFALTILSGSFLWSYKWQQIHIFRAYQSVMRAMYCEWCWHFDFWPWQYDYYLKFIIRHIFTSLALADWVTSLGYITWCHEWQVRNHGMPNSFLIIHMWLHVLQFGDTAMSNSQTKWMNTHESYLLQYISLPTLMLQKSLLAD